MLDKTGELIETLGPISKFCYIITHPRIIFDWIISVSYWLAVLISIAALIYYVGCGSKKALRVLNFTIITYILLKSLAAVI